MVQLGGRSRSRLLEMCNGSKCRRRHPRVDLITNAAKTARCRRPPSGLDQEELPGKSAEWPGCLKDSSVQYELNWSGGKSRHKYPGAGSREPGTGIYIHVPFGAAICNYCNFNRGLHDDGLRQR